MTASNGEAASFVPSTLAPSWRKSSANKCQKRFRAPTQDLWHLMARIPFPESLRSAKGRNLSLIIPAFFLSAYSHRLTPHRDFRAAAGYYRIEA
jgi:hypothetical protein